MSPPVTLAGSELEMKTLPSTEIKGMQQYTWLFVLLLFCSLYILFLPFLSPPPPSTGFFGSPVLFYFISLGWKNPPCQTLTALLRPRPFSFYTRRGSTPQCREQNQKGAEPSFPWILRVPQSQIFSQEPQWQWENMYVPLEHHTRIRARAHIQ